MPERITSETAQAIAAGMPQCPLCGGRNVRPSVAMRFEDKWRAILRYSPYRCRGCQHRFYVRHAPAKAEHAGQAANSDNAKAG